MELREDVKDTNSNFMFYTAFHFELDFIVETKINHIEIINYDL
jgi:hypothetical protein